MRTSILDCVRGTHPCAGHRKKPPAPLPDLPAPARVQHNEESNMMNYSGGWMTGWSNGGMGGPMWLWTAIGIGVIVLLAVVINIQTRK